MSYKTLKAKIEKLIALAKAGKEKTGFVEVLESRDSLIYACAYTNIDEIPSFNIRENVSSAVYMYQHSTAKIINVPNFKNVTNAMFLFNGCENLETIKGELNIARVGQYRNLFTQCTSLKNISFEKNSITKSISFSDSANLTNESVQSIIDGLSDRGGVSASTTLTLHSDVYNRLTDEQQSQIKAKGWNVK